jgi:co-chaperonin GroES (HSP10)
MTTKYLDLPKDQRKAAQERQRYLPFKPVEVLPGFNVPYLLRPGRCVVRVYFPNGFHHSGLILTDKRDKLTAMGHIIALHSDNPNGLALRDFVIFEPYHEYEIDYTDEGGEFVPYVVLNENAILGVVNPPPVRLHTHA